MIKLVGVTLVLVVAVSGQFVVDSPPSNDELELPLDYKITADLDSIGSVALLMVSMIDIRIYNQKEE